MKTRHNLSAVQAIASVAIAATLLAVRPAVGQNLIWLNQFGTSAFDRANGMASDGEGGFMVAGGTSGDLGGPNAGSSDAWIARFDADGTQIWIRQFGTSAWEEVLALAPDGAGGVMVAGATEGSLGGPNAGGFDAFIARYDGAGNRLWIKQIGTSSKDEARALAPDGAGGVMVAGITEGSLARPNAGKADAFLARYDESGNQLWIRQFGSFGIDRANALAPDGAGGVMVAGYTEGSIGGLTAGLDDIFLARFDGTGIRLWIRQFGTSSLDRATALATDSMGGVMIAGYTEGTLGGGAGNGGGSDVFLARYDEAGNQLWLRRTGGGSDDLRPGGLTPDGAGGAFVASNREGAPGTPNAGDTRVLLTYFDGAGRSIWARNISTSSRDDAGPVVSDGEVGVIIAVNTHGSLGGPNAGESDVSLARYGGGGCYACDCDPDPACNIHDFLCFQNSFVRGEPYACDCDPDPICDIFDFLCFQNAFVAGCP
ncbi:MAG: hypothetical protein IH985_04025 [Planctomycetes bacterium]|nr:hypothetical protein [Planctomycetota bacterium]